MGSGSGTYDVPHFGFSFASMALCGHLVIGVHLYAQVVVGINELYQQRELSRIDIADLLPGIGAFADNGLIARDTGEHPAFGAPDKSFEYGVEFVHPTVR